MPFKEKAEKRILIFLRFSFWFDSTKNISTGFNSNKADLT